MRKIISVLLVVLLMCSLFGVSVLAAEVPSVDMAYTTNKGSVALVRNVQAPQSLSASSNYAKFVRLNVTSDVVPPEGSKVYMSFDFHVNGGTGPSLAKTVSGGTYYGGAEEGKSPFDTIEFDGHYGSDGVFYSSGSVTRLAPPNVSLWLQVQLDLETNNDNAWVSIFVNELYYVTPEGQIVDVLNTQLQQDQAQHEETKGLLGNIIDGITSLPGKLVNGIKSLFIPSDDYFSNLIEDEKTLCSDHLGVLYQAWEAFSGVSDALSSDSVDTGLSGTGLDTSFVDYAANNPGSFKFPGLSFDIQGETHTLWTEKVVSMSDYLAQWRLSWVPTLTKLLSGFVILLGFIAWCLKFLYDQFGWQACLTAHDFIVSFGGLFQKGDGE